VIRLAVRVRRDHAELVLAELLELAPAGVEEADAGEDVEYAVYGAPGELPGLPDLQAVAGPALVAVTTTEVADDWQERWRSFHRPVLIPAPAGQKRAGARGGGVPALRVRPPWEPARDAGDAGEEIVIDPGQAFGTGAHASTRLCLELLLELAAGAPQRGALLDIGTGSGVLAIAAARLGFAPVLGVDNDRESVAAARANATVNDAALAVLRLDLRREGLPPPHADAGRWSVVTANLLCPLLCELARAMRFAPEHLIAGGLLAGQASDVAAAFSVHLGLRERERRAEGEWEALWLSLA
jgi:ribosomal protein L11 methyltransferase